MRRLLCVVFLAACASRGKTPEYTSLRPRLVAPKVIYRAFSFVDPKLVARGIGSLYVVSRSGDRPTQLMPYWNVQLVKSPHDTIGRFDSDERGLVQFDALAAGTYDVLIRRVGIAWGLMRVEVVAGCRTDLEAYMGVISYGPGGIPITPTRAVATMCRKTR